jgi:hypothetical protein
MIETLAVFMGLCVTLYLCFWLFETITGRLKPYQDDRSAALDLASAVSEGLMMGGEYHSPMACGIEAGLCPETAEAIVAAGEGIQAILEVAGEGLGQVIGGL